MYAKKLRVLELKNDLKHLIEKRQWYEREVAVKWKRCN